MDEEGPTMCLPGCIETSLDTLSHWQLSDLAEMEGYTRKGATTDELRDFVTQRKYSTSAVHWNVAGVPVEHCGRLH